MPRNLHIELKIALSLENSNIAEFSRSLKKPDGTVGISHSAVIRAAKGTEPTEWIVAAIKKTIQQARKKHPDVYQSIAQPES